MKYQLVLQLPASSIKDYDALIELEDSILPILGEVGVVDGHDAGAGEMNIFIHTDDPEQAFEAVSALLDARSLMSGVKVAFREFGSDNFTILHPRDAKDFSIA